MHRLIPTLGCLYWCFKAVCCFRVLILVCRVGKLIAVAAVYNYNFNSVFVPLVAAKYIVAAYSCCACTAVTYFVVVFI